MPPTVTSISQLAYGTGDTAPATNLLDFEDFSPGFGSEFVNADRNRGTLDYQINRSRQIRERIEPTLKMIPTAAEWLLLLPWILGGTSASGGGLTTFECGNAAVERCLQWTDGNGNTDTANNVAVRSATISTVGQDGACGLELATVGRVFTTATAFPALTNIDNVTTPFVLPDTSGAVLLATVPISCSDLSFTITQQIDDRFLNAIRQTANVKVDRRIGVSLTYPDGEFQTLYTSAEAGIAVAITFTAVNGAATYRLVMTMPKVRFPREPRQVRLRGELMNTLNGFAYETTSGATIIPPVSIGIDAA